jgi:hypothetical protein
MDVALVLELLDRTTSAPTLSRLQRPQLLPRVLDRGDKDPALLERVGVSAARSYRPSSGVRRVLDRVGDVVDGAGQPEQVVAVRTASRNCE